MNRKHRKRFWVTIEIIVAVLVAFIGVGEAYFFNVAFVPGKKAVLNKYSSKNKKDPLAEKKRWYEDAKKQRWYIKSNTGNYRLDANYIPKKNSDKTVVLLHGFTNNKDTMGPYAAMFHQMGYNVLMPDARAHGQSQGKYIGYGWPEKYDVRKWVRKLIAEEGKKQKIVIFGVSMGGATTMMASGIKMPSQVKAYIEDCGYTSVRDEFLHEAKDIYHLPGPVGPFFVNGLSVIAKANLGFYLGDASAVNSVEKNNKPMLFIHGGKDPFVPTKMVYANYKAAKGPKQLWIAKKAKHARSFETYPREYQRRVSEFLKKYV
ncbi:alpha/beta hydrolase [Lactobacillus crispatus]|uniref:alpha/beta hydrolase n=1 Tax=Lactobacillus crispatus TaxID=47770 RepID=UPI003F25839D